MWARYGTVALAVWLVISTFCWPHGAQEWMTVGLMSGCFLLVMSGAAFVEPGVRAGSGIVGALLALYSLFAHPYVSFTRWHDFAVGILFLLLALVPSQPLQRHEVRPTRRITT